MNISLRKTKTIFIKDFIDSFKNPTSLIMFLLPIGMVLLYSQIFPTSFPMEAMLSMAIPMNITMTAAVICSTSIAEEKEKNTLRTLMLSNVSSQEFFLSKILSASLFTLIGNVIIFFIIGMNIKFLLGFILISILGAISISVIGGLVGIIARDQMTVGVYQVPVMIVIMFPPLLAGLNETIASVAKFTPCNGVIELINSLIKGNLFTTDSLFHLAVILVWIVISLIAFRLLYRKASFDN